MGSPSRATPARRDLVAMERKHRAEKAALARERRRLLDKLAGATAERDSLMIACRIKGAALAKATVERDELAEECRRVSSEDLDS